MDGNPCWYPTPALDDWSEALKLAAEWDAAAARAATATHEPPPTDRRPDPFDC
jgi:hypothetical protein